MILHIACLLGNHSIGFGTGDDGTANVSADLAAGTLPVTKGAESIFREENGLGIFFCSFYNAACLSPD